MGRIEEMGNFPVQVEKAQQKNADILYPFLLERLGECSEKNKKVIAISGGSGVGKTGMAWLLSERFRADGILSLIVSGDHYPHRIPMYNDAERLRIFRAAGLRGLLAEDVYDEKVRDELRKLQEEEKDAQETPSPWLGIYQRWGDAALGEYLGTEQELLFSEVSSVLSLFKKGEKTLMLRQMGRQAHEIWYEKADVEKTQVLILEWTHANSPLLSGVDVSIVLKSTPEQTLENRKKRNRDAGAGSAFVARVLRIEQEKIDAELVRADLVQDMEGNMWD